MIRDGASIVSSSSKRSLLVCSVGESKESVRSKEWRRAFRKNELLVTCELRVHKMSIKQFDNRFSEKRKENAKMSLFLFSLRPFSRFN